MRKLVSAVVLIPLALIIVMFAVANRQTVVVSLDPFEPSQPALSLAVPLFALAFVMVGIGVLVGGVAAWMRQHKWRVRARRAEADARELRARIDAEPSRIALPSHAQSPPFAVPPAA